MKKEEYRKVVELMKKERSKKHFSKKDVMAILEARKTGDWSEVYKSKLYNKYSCEYCSLLEVTYYVFNQ